MHPNLFLRTFWQMELRPQVFVAMSFAPQYQERYDKVIAPAIGAILDNNVPLKAYRVDISKTGDSILTDIMDGIAHSRMILADVSVVGRDFVSGRAYRNGNVMYEVGLALAARQPQDVLLVRDDTEDFLFDVSTIPHKRLDFTKGEVARHELQMELMERLRQQEFLNDARVQMAIASLSTQELKQLKHAAKFAENTVWGIRGDRLLNLFDMASVPRLLDKGLIRVAGEFTDGGPAYRWTPLGHVVAQIVAGALTQFQPGNDANKYLNVGNLKGGSAAGKTEAAEFPGMADSGSVERSQ